MQCQECSAKHPSVLHVAKEVTVTPENTEDASTEGTDEAASAFVATEHETCGATGAGNKECVLAIIPVKIKTKQSDKVNETHAFMDQGSTATFCTEDLMRQLNV